MTTERAATIRRRWGWAAIASAVAAVVLAGTPLDDYLSLVALGGTGYCLIEHSYYVGWLARDRDARSVEVTDRR